MQLHNDLISDCKRPGSFRRSGEEQIAGFERTGARKITDHHLGREDHLIRRCALLELAIDVERKAKIFEWRRRFERNKMAYLRRAVKPLGKRPGQSFTLEFILKIAHRQIQANTIAGNNISRAECRDVTAAAPKQKYKLSFEFKSFGLRR